MSARKEDTIHGGVTFRVVETNLCFSFPHFQLGSICFGTRAPVILWVMETCNVAMESVTPRSHILNEK